MSDKLKNILILGFIFELIHILITNPLNSIFLVVAYAVLLIILLIKKEFKLFNKLKEKCPRTTNYVVNLGWLWFVSLIAMAFLLIFQCADPNTPEGQDCIKNIPEITKYLFYIYLAVAATGIGYATSVSFPIKKK